MLLWQHIFLSNPKLAIEDVRVCWELLCEYVEFQMLIIYFLCCCSLKFFVNDVVDGSRGEGEGSVDNYLWQLLHNTYYTKEMSGTDSGIRLKLTIKSWSFFFFVFFPCASILHMVRRSCLEY